MAVGPAGAAAEPRVRCRPRRGSQRGSAGARASGIRAAAFSTRGTVGSDGCQAAIAGGSDRRHLVHPHVPRQLTGWSVFSIERRDKVPLMVGLAKTAETETSLPVVGERKSEQREEHADEEGRCEDDLAQ